MNDDIIKIPVYMLDDEAEKFIAFQKHFDLFSLLLEKKVFEQKGATITLHFDSKGTLKTITRADVLYLSTTPFDNTNTKNV
jgi:hypothetical protein